MLIRILVISIFFSPAFCQTPVQRPDSVLLTRALQLARQFLIVDTHIDLPLRLQNHATDVSLRTTDGDFDYVRAREGGLDVAFMSIYVPSSMEGTGKAKPAADKLIDIVLDIATRWPQKFAVVRSVSDVLAFRNSGRILLPLGMENGSPIEGDLRNVQYFYERGIRYITLTHAKSNHICDSSYDKERTWGGLSPFGRQLIREMNRLGIMVDVSHVTDSTFYQVLRLTTAPVIASHSSCRAFTPGFERNMDDEMIRALAANGGVIQINFGSEFLRSDILLHEQQREKDIDEHMKKHHLAPGGKEAGEYAQKYRREHPLTFADVKDVANQIDHVVQLVGVDHVGFGSDFEGVGDTLPLGLKDVAHYPNLLAELLRRGYSEEAIEKICSGNLLRVWASVEKRAR